MKLILFTAMIFSLNVFAKDKVNILVNKDLLHHLNISYPKNSSDLALVEVNQEQLDEISHHAHDFHRCDISSSCS